MQAANGALVIDTPFDTAVDVTVLGSRFFAAMNVCDAPTITVAKSGKSLSIKQGSFRASIPLIDNIEFPMSSPDGDRYDAPEDLQAAFSMMRPFFGTQKEWMKGVVIRNGNLYATNGLALLRNEIGLDASIAITVPEVAIIELSRINLPITALRISDHSCTFKLGDSIWLRTALITGDVPDMDGIIPQGAPDVVPDGLREAVTTVAQFSDGVFPVVQFGPDGVSAVGDTEAHVGGFELPPGMFGSDVLMAVLEIATHMDFSKAPKACKFTGKNIAGAVMGRA